MVSSLFYHKQGFHVARAETPPRERDLASDLRIAKMHHRQKFGVRPSLSLIGLDHDMSLMCVCCWSTGRLSVTDTFFSLLERLVALVRPQIFFSCTLEKLGRTLELGLGDMAQKIIMIIIFISVDIDNYHDKNA